MCDCKQKLSCNVNWETMIDYMFCYHLLINIHQNYVLYMYERMLKSTRFSYNSLIKVISPNGTSLFPMMFTEMPVLSHENEQLCICVLCGMEFTSISKIIQLDSVDFFHFNIINDFFWPNAEIIHRMW